MLNHFQKNKLLEIAGQTIETYFKKHDFLKGCSISDSVLNEHRGAFVTLKDKKGFLRGCIGRIESDKPLFKTISEMALQAAFNDPRFEPLTQDEFNNIKIEISVLTKPERVENINEIKVGRDGLIIKKGFYSGLLLPQVASEFNWNRQEFLEHTCIKAGLPKNVWEYSEIYKFSAEVFGLS